MILNAVKFDKFNVTFSVFSLFALYIQVYIKTATVCYTVSVNFAHLINIEYKSPYGYELTFVEVAIRWQCLPCKYA